MRCNKNINFNVRNITLFFTILTLSLTNIILCLSSNSVSALSYSSNVNIGFTFSPTLSVSLSNDSLSISELALGATGVSNEINIAVSTNTAYGYTLSATVGNDSTYDGDSLYNSVDHTNTFTNIAIDADLTSLSDGNTWGYSYKDNTASTPAWSNYNGLPLYSSTAATLLDTNTNTSGSADIKIAAKVDSSQASGEYNNVINFTVVSKPIPVTLLDAFIAYNAEQYNGYYTMQSMTPEICSLAEEGSELQLIDIRDNKLYWVAKLKDHNCWMTQNLDLDLSSSVALTSETSDIDPESYGTTIYTAETGYSKDETTGVVSWLPSTIDDNGIQRADTIDMIWGSTTSATAPGWTNNNYGPYSANAGDRYRYTNSSGNEAVYTSLNACLANVNDKSGCQHTGIGNYYNWSAAIASNNTSAASNNSSWDNSICPKNWDLPVNGKYGTMLQTQEVWSGSNNSYATNGYLKIRTSPLFFIKSGTIDGDTVYSFGNYGNYWSSTVSFNTLSYDLNFSANDINPSYEVNRNRYLGFSVRCIGKAL